MIGRLFSLVTLGSTVGSNLANIATFQCYLKNIIGIIVLTIVSAMMVGALVVAAFYALYIGLLRQGLNPDSAFLCVFAWGVLITLLLAGVAAARVARLRVMTIARATPRTPLAQAEGIFHAFVDGYKNRQQAKASPKNS